MSPKYPKLLLFQVGDNIQHQGAENLFNNVAVCVLACLGQCRTVNQKMADFYRELIRVVAT